MDDLNCPQSVPIKSLDALFQEMGPYAIFLASVFQGKFLYVSEAMREIDGYDPELHRTGGFAFNQSIVHPDDYACYIRHFVYQMARPVELKDQQGLSGTHTFRIRHADGHYCWVTKSYICLDFEESRPNTVFGYYKNNSREKVREAFLLQQLKQEMPATQFSKMLTDYCRLSGDFNPRSFHLPDGAGLLQIPLTQEEPVKITKREMEILKHISNGLSDKQIADQLSISYHTAVNHRKNLIQKYGAKNTAELIKTASKAFWL